MSASIPRKPVCEATSHDAHHNRFGVAPIGGLGGSPDEGAAFVAVFKETIRNSKLAWKKIGEARFHRHHGLHGIPHSLPYSVSVDLSECLRALPNEVWEFSAGVKSKHHRYEGSES